MRSNIIPLCNEEFINKAVLENKRLDGRKCGEYRDLNLVFGIDYGCCIVSLGHSKIMASVSAEIAEPSASRPYEGQIKILLDFSPIASPFFETNKISDANIEIQRFLEKMIKDSRCLDLESLCLIAGEKVWDIKVSLIVLNADGNLVETSSIAMMAALMHFKRPEVLVFEDKLHIYSFEEKHPLPLTVLHYPFCSMFAFFKDKFVCDPSEVEEQVCRGYLIVASNSYREVTSLHISGKSQIDKQQVMKCCTNALDRSKYLATFVKEHLARDNEMRTDSALERNEIGFVAAIIAQEAPLCITLKDEQELEEEEMEVVDSVPKIEFQLSQGSKMYRFVEKKYEKPKQDLPFITPAYIEEIEAMDLNNEKKIIKEKIPNELESEKEESENESEDEVKILDNEFNT